MKKNKLRVVMLSGDWIPLSMPERIKSAFHAAEVISLGGATEASIWSIWHPVKKLDEDWKSIPYGKPLANQKFYVMNNELELCPVGVQGELYIGGAGVAEGYLNDARRTGEAFIEHPEFGRLYRTGDFGILHKDGNLEFTGRKDHQVKIRGYRIEMGEIESRLLKHPQITQAVVTDHTDENNRKSLCAYMVTAGEIDTGDIKAYLAEALPDYMIPARFITLDQFPLNVNGKIDRNNLPDPELIRLEKQQYTEAENETEQWLVEVWKELLNTETVGIEDNFFELGGDSLFAGQLIMKVQQEWNVEIPVDLMFEEPTIKKIASFITENSVETVSAHAGNMILLKKGTGSENIFFVHAGLGEVDIYRELSTRSREEFTCWGIKGRFGDSLAPQNLKIEELARQYLEDIKTVQKDGPYYLGGWCVGGTIAFEIARLLEAESREVRLVALFNAIAPADTNPEDKITFTPETEIAVSKEIVSAVEQELENSGNNEEWTLDDFWNTFLDFIDNNGVSIEHIRINMPRNVIELIPQWENWDSRKIFRGLNSIRSMQRARACYSPSVPLLSPVCFFEARSSDLATGRHWEQHCAGALQVIEVEGDHVSMFHPPQVDALANWVNGCL